MIVPCSVGTVRGHGMVALKNVGMTWTALPGSTLIVSSP